MRTTWMRRYGVRVIVYTLLLGAIIAVFPLRTLPGRMLQYGFIVRHRLRPVFAQQQAPYPPSALVMAAFKDSRRLELYAPDAGGRMRFLRAYPILAASGEPGPKLREGDGQVPEGIYRITALNPKSALHLAMRVEYPNAFDRAMARADGRMQLGGDIMIHGGDVSTGCLAVGNTAVEDLFVLAADTGLRRVTLIISPVDFRTKRYTRATPTWTPRLYAQISQRLRALPTPRPVRR